MLLDIERDTRAGVGNMNDNFVFLRFSGDVDFTLTLLAVLAAGLFAWFPVRHRRQELRVRDGFVVVALFWVVLAVVGEVAVFLALVLAARDGAGLHFDAGGAVGNGAVLLALLGFGIKAGALPLHLWLPLARPAAPVPASAVLSGAMIKAGLLGWLRLLPLGEAAAPSLAQWGALLVALGLGFALGWDQAVQMQEILENALLAVMAGEQQPTFVHVFKLLTDADYRYDLR